MMAGEERRTHRRFPVRWKVATLLGQWHIREIRHGNTQDLSLGGVSILCDHNDWGNSEEILILLFPYSTKHEKRSRHIEVCGRVVQVTSASGLNRARVRVAFTEYRNHSNHWLSELLTGNPMPAVV